MKVAWKRVENLVETLLPHVRGAEKEDGEFGYRDSSALVGHSTFSHLTRLSVGLVAQDDILSPL